MVREGYHVEMDIGGFARRCSGTRLGLGKRGHGDVPFREEVRVDRRVFRLVVFQDGNLTNHQKLVPDSLLKISIFAGVHLIERGTDDGDSRPTGFKSGSVSTSTPFFTFASAWSISTLSGSIILR